MPDKSLHAVQDELFRAQVARARRRSMGEKLLDGERLFHENAVWMKAGIRARHPQLSASEIEAEYRRRLAIARRFDDELFEKVGPLCV